MNFDDPTLISPMSGQAFAPAIVRDIPTRYAAYCQIAYTLPRHGTLALLAAVWMDHGVLDNAGGLLGHTAHVWRGEVDLRMAEFPVSGMLGDVPLWLCGLLAHTVRRILKTRVELP